MHNGQHQETPSPMTSSPGNIIIQSASPLLNYLVELKLKLSKGEQISPDVLRNDAKTLLSDVEKKLLEHSRFHTRLDLIKYVLTALIDEVIIFSSWEYHNEWQNHPLEMDLFEKNIAGERFFELLENDGYRDPELAELFFVCLAIGFDRKIVRDKEMKKRLYALINERLPEDERRLSPGAEEAVVKPISILPPLFGIVAITTVLIVSMVVYTISSQLLWHEASEFIHNVSRNLTKGY
ncbi:type IVB secretion system protein IcmH/DotU [Desulfobacter curvatus]|uniref:type IVB secretion system protein IcmH/DotU n=1 Tax=Desulfobacter curvatus TaxID=2290 RepID=UPI000A061D0F|nr:type IVB secretion system protein IcmH/DotU [Desulfobacter curvatus]